MRRGVVIVKAAGHRMRGAVSPALQAAAAAALAWYAAHDLLGHAQPFFAPIAAAVALSTSQVQRARRSAQMVTGVLLGIGIAELLHPLVGDSTLAVGVVALAALLVAAGFGFGFFGEGMMFVNQAAASAILVITLHRAGTGAERATDALIGGASALLVGVVTFPVEPLALLGEAQKGVLRSLLGILEDCEQLLSAARSDCEDGEEGDLALAASHRVHDMLTRLTLARRTAHVVVRVAPRRLHLRGMIDAEDRRLARMYLLAGDALGVLRAALGAHDAGLPPRACASLLGRSAAVLRLLAEAPWPWAGETVAEASASARELLSEPVAREPPSAVLLSGALHVLARDLVELLAGA